MTDHRFPDDAPILRDAVDPQLQDLLRDAREHYNVPQTLPAFEGMWARVEREAFGSQGQAPTADVLPMRARRRGAARLFRNYGAWAGLAAGLVIGVIGGRQSIRPAASPALTAKAVQASAPDTPVDAATARYLGQTAALLVSLPVEPRGTVIDANFADRAQQLLSTTRLLLDAATEPETRALLEDLELVLAQIVGIQAGNRREELELINQALEQRELLPRLQSAVNANSVSAD